MPRAGLTPDLVLDHAQAIADEVGFEALDLTRLASACGVRKPSLYKHVDGLDGVREGLVLRAYDGLAEVLAGSPADGAEGLVAFAHAWRRWALAHPGLYGALVRSHVHQGPAVQARGREVLDTVLVAVGALGLDPREALDLARALRALVHGWVVLELGAGFGLSEGPGTSFDRAVRTLVRGAVDVA